MKPLAPAELRAAGADITHVLFPVRGTDCEMLADAIEIADAHTASLLESCTTPIYEGSTRWCDSNTDDGNEEEIAQAVRYLEARELLDRHPDNPHWVSPRSPE